MSVNCFQSAELSDIGKKRKNNEDACLRVPERGMYLVADGMGGVVGGDVASEKVVTVLNEAFTTTPADAPESLLTRVTLFQSAANTASKWIRNFAEEKAVGQMGSTIVAIVFDPLNPKRAMGLHAGDSRLYRFRNKKLELLTVDHTAVEVLAKKLGRDPSSLPAKYQNELVKAIGLAETVDLEKTRVNVASGDLFMLCCDGLTRMLSDEEISRTLGQGAALDATAKSLINAANEAGGKDNITVVLIKAGDLSQFPDAPTFEEFNEAPPAAVTEGSERETKLLTVVGDATVGPTRQDDTPHSDDNPMKEGVTPPTRQTETTAGDTPPTARPSEQTLTPPTPPPASPPPKPGGRPVPRIVVVIATAFIVITGGVLLTRKSATSTKAPADWQTNMEHASTRTTPTNTPATAPPPPTTGSVTINSTPGGVDVFYQGKRVGTTPFAANNLQAGGYPFTLGSLTATGMVTAAINAGQKWATNVVLEARMGRVIIESDPPGAAVLLDGQQMGQTPLSFQSQAGPAQFTLRLAGLGDQPLDMTVMPSETTRTNAVFAYGTLVLQSEPSGAIVRQEGNIVGHTPLSNNLPPGRTTWQLSAEGWETTNVTIAIIDHRQSIEKVVMRKPGGILQISGNQPGAQVRVDGAILPALPASLPVDADVDHTVTASFEGQEKSSVVSVHAGESKAVEFVFAAAPQQPGRWTNKLGMAFVKLPSGPVWISAERVTPEQYEKVMNETPNENIVGEDDHQRCAINISAARANAFAEKLTATSQSGDMVPAGLEGYHFALPTPDLWKEAADHADALAISMKELKAYKEWCLSRRGSDTYWFYGGYFEQNNAFVLTYKPIFPAPKPDQPRQLAIRLMLVK